MLLRLIAACSLGLAMAAANADEHAYAHSSSADQQQSAALSVSRPWARAMPPGAPANSVYFEVANRSSEDRRLVGVSSPRAERAELHTTQREGDMLRMLKLEHVEIPAGTEVGFASGANHVMLFGVKETLKPGDRFPLTLTFDNGETLTFEVVVGDQDPGHAQGGHGQHSH